MAATRLRAFIVGGLFILAAVSSIIGYILYAPLLHDPEYMTKGFANETQVIWGAFLEIVLVFSMVGIAIGMFPVLKKYNESFAMGYVCFRLLESAIVAMGIMSVLTVVTLSRQVVTAPASDLPAYLTVGKSLVAFHSWTFLFGPNVSLGPSTLMMSYLLFKSGLVPRFIASLGMIGGPLILISAIFVMFGLYGQTSATGALFALPVFAYEMSLAVWLMVKGFNAKAEIGRL